MIKNQTQTPEENLTLSTYRLITVKRLLERYKIDLDDRQIALSFKETDTFYHRLLSIPLKNIMNGIILQQARDYQLYLQKLFVDYLLALEAKKSASETGEESISATEQAVEEARKELIQFNDHFNELEISHQRIIGNSQVGLVNHAAAWKKKIQEVGNTLSDNFSGAVKKESVLKILNNLLVYVPLAGSSLTSQDLCWLEIEKQTSLSLKNEDRQVFLQAIPELIRFALESDDSLSGWREKITDMTRALREAREFFQQTIMKVNTFLVQMSEYSMDEAKNQKNREELYFDPTLGEKKDT